MSDINDTVDTLKLQITELQAKLENSEAKVTMLSGNEAAHTRRIQELKATIEKLSDDVRYSDLACERFRDATEHRRREADELRKRLAAAGAMSQSDETVLLLRKQIDELQHELVHTKRRYEASCTQLDAATNLNIQTGEKLRDAETRRSVAVEESDKLRRQFETEKVARHNAEQAMARSRLDREDAIMTLNREACDLNMRLMAAHGAGAEKDDKIESLRCELKEYNPSYEKMAKAADDVLVAAGLPIPSTCTKEEAIIQAIAALKPWCEARKQNLEHHADMIKEISMLRRQVEASDHAMTGLERRANQTLNVFGIDFPFTASRVDMVAETLERVMRWKRSVDDLNKSHGVLVATLAELAEAARAELNLVDLPIGCCENAEAIKRGLALLGRRCKENKNNYDAQADAVYSVANEELKSIGNSYIVSTDKHQAVMEILRMLGKHIRTEAARTSTERMDKLSQQMGELALKNTRIDERIRSLRGNVTKVISRFGWSTNADQSADDFLYMENAIFLLGSKVNAYKDLAADRFEDCGNLVAKAKDTEKLLSALECRVQAVALEFNHVLTDQRLNVPSGRLDIEFINLALIRLKEEVIKRKQLNENQFELITGLQSKLADAEKKTASPAAIQAALKHLEHATGHIKASCTAISGPPQRG
jgi:chromosome segregation ATPase